MKSMWSRKFWKHRIQNSVVPKTKIVWPRIDCFGSLIRQWSHMLLLSITFTCFEFIPHKNKSWVWGQSRNMDTYIYFTLSKTLSQLDSFVSLTLILIAFALVLSSSQQVIQSSQQNYVHCYYELGIFASLQYSKLCMVIKITSQIHMFS